jgi:predicted RNase H-like HicB family nuclease
MEFTVVITKEPDKPWRAAAPGFTEIEVEAETRDQVIERIKERLVESLHHREIVRVEVPVELELAYSLTESHNNKVYSGIPEGFGSFRNNPILDEMFDEIERRRDELMVIAGEVVEVTQAPDEYWHAVVVAHPEYKAKAGTRDEVMDKIERLITEYLSREEDERAEISLASD